MPVRRATGDSVPSNRAAVTSVCRCFSLRLCGNPSLLLHQTAQPLLHNSLPRTLRVRLDRIRSRSKPIKPPVAFLAPKWPYRYQCQHRQFEYASTLRTVNVFAVAMRAYHRHGTSPLSTIPIRNRKLRSSTAGTQCGIALARFSRPPHLAGPHVQIAGRQGREKTPSPQPWLQGSLSSLAIRARSYARSQIETVLFCTLPPILPVNLPPAIRALIVRRSAQRRPPSSPQRRRENAANRDCVLTSTEFVPCSIYYLA